MTLTNRNQRVEDLIVGRAHPTSGPDAAVDRFLHALRMTIDAEPAPRPTPALHARLRDGRPVRVVSLARWNTGRRLQRRARTMVLVAATSVAAFSTVTAAGALPAPVQHASAVLADKLGIHVPDPTAPRHAPRPNPRPAGSSPQPSPSTNPSQPVTPTTGSSTAVPSAPIPVPLQPGVPTSPTVPPLPGLPQTPSGSEVTDLLG